MWKKAVFGTVSAGFLGYVVWVSCLSTTRHQIEWDVATRVTAVLERTGFSNVVPVVDGRDVELRGEVLACLSGASLAPHAETGPAWGIGDAILDEAASSVPMRVVDPDYAGANLTAAALAPCFLPAT